MARSAAPTKPVNGNGHSATNGQHDGNGHGTKTKPTGYHQLTPGEKPTWTGLTIERRFTRPGVHPYDTVEWDLREAAITNEHGKVVFEQRDLEFPKTWSALATNVVASKYFRGHLGTPERERSVRQMIDRVADTIADWGVKDAYFATDEDADAFRNELKDILLKQRAAFNSPVWFNVGIDARPQCSACQPYDALVSTPEGMKPIGRLVDDNAVGTEVYDANGVTRIVAVKNNGHKPVWRIRLANGNFVEATPDHVVKAVHERRTSPEWLRVDQLEVGMRMHLHPHRSRVAPGVRSAVAVGALDGAAHDVPSFASEMIGSGSMDPNAEVMRAEAALAGWLQADGFVGQYESGTNRSLTIEFQVANDDEYAWVMSNLDIAMPLVHLKVREADTKATRVQRIRIYGEVIRDFVERWDLLRRGTDIRVPDRLWTASYDEVCAYLRSIFQADGYVSVRRSNGQESARVAFAVIGERWAEDVQLLLNSIGIYSRRQQKREKRPDRHDLHEVSIAVGSERARFAELVGFVGADKRARLLESLSLQDLKSVPNVREELIVAIEELGVREVYDIQTESGEYLTNNVAVHNCFINSVDDTMESILTLAKTEGMLFKFGSGTGSNLSTIRSSKETLAGGGEASGPVSFMKGFDAFAGVIKSGGKTRRAAKMVILNADHPDVEEFIDCKLNEERKAWALIDAGYDGNFNGGEAYASVFFQNSNNSVRVTDAFMEAVEADADWGLRAVTTGETLETVQARKLMNKMAQAAWVCGDPGIQYHDTVNRWNPVAGTHTINGSNPCVTGDTLVATDEGWRRIDSLVGKKANVIGADGQPHPVDRIFPTGTKPVFELKTRSGYRVNITADHLVSTQRGDVAVKDLTAKDRVFLNAPGFGRKELSPQLAEAIGLAVGDGYLGMGANRTEMVIITMHENEFGVLEMVAKEVNHQKEMLRAVGMPGQTDPVQVTRTPNGPRVAFGSKVVVDQFKQHAVLDQGSDGKRFTDEVYDLDRSSQAALLRGLFTADGTVRNGGDKSQYVALDSVSLDLLVQVQRMLLGFGIVSRIYENRRSGTLRALLPDGKGGTKEYPVKQMHSLRITRDSRLRFEKEIGFAPESPKVQALRLLNSTVSTYSDELVDDFRSIEPLGDAPVFDLTESATNHFIANGISVHNCSEYMHIDDSACNLASLNLMRFVGDDGEFQIEDYRHAVRIVFTAQEILVSNSSYPTPKIEENSHAFRPIGIGYANLGAVLMNRGLAYDSDEGRAYSAAITSLMQSESALQSARIARDQGGPFAAYAPNREAYTKVMRMHRDAAYRVDRDLIPTDMVDAVLTGWDEVVALGEKTGFRNSQLSVLAPTGCLTGDSLVITDRGLVRLRSLGNPDGTKWQDLDARVATDDGPQQATKFYVNGAEPVVTVTTSRGYRIRGTTTHRIRILDADATWQWRRFADIRKDDRVPMMLGGMVGEPREVALPPLAEAYWTSDHTAFAPRYMNADLAELIGYFMGDGSLHSKGLRFCVTASDTDVANRLVALGKSLFGIDASVTAKQGYTEVAFHSVRLTLWWEACGFAKRAPHGEHRGKGYESHIPEAVLYTNDPAVYRAFVRGLFEADGNANHGYAYWATVSEQFSHDVQSLLLALGFVTTRKTDEPGYGHMGKNPIHYLRLLNTKTGARFLSEIGFISERKREALVDLDHPQAARHDLVPVSRAVVDRLAPENDSLRKTMLLSLSRTGLVSRRSATALLERTADPELEQSLGYFYDTIASAELGEEQLTYDISVPSNVTYVANGFVSHNTISFLMDCDTTGVEPDIALIKYKRLVGGGYLKIVNQSVPTALRKLGYTAAQTEEIVAWIDEHETIEGAPGLRDEHLEVFDCAFKPANGTRSIHYNGHLKMMAAVQPFISGAISKTVNMPEHSTADEIAQVYIDGWKLGLKAIAVYRDNSKRSQPLNTKKEGGDAASQTDAGAAAPEVQTVYKPLRRRLPDERASITHKFNVGGHEGYLTIGLYPDGTPGEIFLRMAKEGSTISGLMDAFATAVSLALQYGVPLKDLVNKFSHLRFEPAGFTGNRDIPMAKSLVDYIFRYMATKFMSQADKDQVGIINRQLTLSEAQVADAAATSPTATPDGAATGLHAASTASDPSPARSAEGDEATTGSVGAPAPEAATQRADSSLASIPVVVGEEAVVNSLLDGLKIVAQNVEAKDRAERLAAGQAPVVFDTADSPACTDCGSIMVRNGSCYKCINCGATSGCS